MESVGHSDVTFLGTKKHGSFYTFPWNTLENHLHHHHCHCPANTLKSLIPIIEVGRVITLKWGDLFKMHGANDHGFIFYQQLSFFVTLWSNGSQPVGHEPVESQTTLSQRSP